MLKSLSSAAVVIGAVRVKNEMVNVPKLRTLVACQKGADKNSTDPDQTASAEIVISGSSLFASQSSILEIPTLTPTLYLKPDRESVGNISPYRATYNLQQTTISNFAAFSNITKMA